VGTIRSCVISTVAIPLSLFVWAPAEVAAESPLTLRLNVNDYAGVAADVRADAAKVTRHIYAAIGVDIVWVDGCPVSCHVGFSREAQTDATSGSLTVMVLPDDMTSREFPAAMMGGSPKNSYVAYAFFDRIRAFAFGRDLLPATLLGHVIAHEAGHILLREGHTAKGLMRAEWVHQDLLRAKHGRLGFTGMQGRRIRSVLTVVPDPPKSADAPAR
jgi:hypothetical protein